MLKKAVIALVVVFIGFWLFTDPHGLADVSKAAGTTGWSGVSALFESVIQYVGDVL